MRNLGQHDNGNKLRFYQRGFSLIELTVVLMVIGLLIGAAITLVRPYVESYRYESTRKKMEVIADSIAMYAQQNYFIPCPANPGPWGTGGTPRWPGVSASLHTSGIVPFRVLGLDESQVKDAYGNYITYRYNRFLGCSENATSAHARRDSNAALDVMNTFASGGNRYKNSAKANFCSSDRASMTVTNRAGQSQFIRDAESTSSLSTEVVAFALISHGKNMMYAFSPATGAQSGGFASTAIEGGYGDASVETLIVAPLNTNVGANYFDDIGIYRTNYQLMEAMGGEGCMKP